MAKPKHSPGDDVEVRLVTPLNWQRPLSWQRAKVESYAGGSWYVVQLQSGLRRDVRTKDIRPGWSGMCLTGKHGLDFKGQDCDVCAHDAGAPCGNNCRRCHAERHKERRR